MTTSTPSTSLAIFLSISIPACPRAIILLIPCWRSSSAAFFSESISGRNLMLGPGPGLEYLVKEEI